MRNHSFRLHDSSLVEYYKSKCFLIHTFLAIFSIVLAYFVYSLEKTNYYVSAFSALFWINLAPDLIYFQNVLAFHDFYKIKIMLKQKSEHFVLSKKISKALQFAWYIPVLLFVIAFCHYHPRITALNFWSKSFFIILVIIVMYFTSIGFISIISSIYLTMVMLNGFWKRQSTFDDDYVIVNNIVMRYSLITGICVLSGVLLIPIVVEMFKVITGNYKVYLNVILIIYILSIFIVLITPSLLCYYRFAYFKHRHISYEKSKLLKMLESDSCNNKCYQTEIETLKSNIEMFAKFNPNLNNYQLFNEIIIVLIATIIPMLITHLFLK